MKNQVFRLLAVFTLTASAGFAQAINVTATGVGVGTAVPASQLHVKDPSFVFTAEINLARFDYYNGRSLQLLGPLIDDVGSPFTIQTKNALQFRMDDTNVMIIDPVGSVGIGTSTPQEKLDVAGNIKVNSAVLAPTGSAPMYAARAWVNFNGTGSNGTDQVIRSSGNVTRVYKNTTGTYTIYFTTAMPDANYCISGSASIDGGGSSGRMVLPVTVAASEALIELRAGGGGLNNSTIVHVVFYR